MRKPLILIIMDGFGINSDKKGNAVAAASTPNLDRLFFHLSLYNNWCLRHGCRFAGRSNG